MASTLPRLPVFEAIARHDPESTVVVHSNSGRRFKYGELLGDVCVARNRIYESAATTDINGERIAFLVGNSYDYVGKPVSGTASFGAYRDHIQINGD
jgi:malonyl-CoA/methylmalonyl-CoA synthetase